MKRIFLSLLVMISLYFSATSSEQSNTYDLKIGVSESPPFVYFDGDKVIGVSDDLWRNIADSLTINYKYVRFSNYIDLLSCMKRGEIDMTINPLTLTDSRLADFRLTIPFYTSRLGLAQHPSYRIPLITVFLSVMNWRTLQLVLLLCSVVFIFAVLIWLAEKRKNPKEFRKGHKGLTDGIWWAFVTMTTVGYGDKVPRTKLGRILTLIWMFYAIALLFVFTAEISSELTVTKLQGNFSTVDELRKIKVGTLEQTGFSSFCRINRIQYTPYTNLAEGIKAIDEKKIEAFVGDVATLEYLFDKYKLGKDLEITPSTLNEQYFCFGAARDHLELIDRINPVLLNVTESAEWVEILYKNGIKQ
ncbi:MAG: transporter substrate-binding domain-containing protein [Bacteroidales bacterium]|nr:transporter substrate-binding domain-containing protein [Bacteroidales bacterium]